PGDLSRLLRDQSAPDRIALGPEILTLVVEAPGVAIDHDAERYAVDSRADAAIVERCARIDGDAMRLRRIADRVRARIEHELQQHAGVEAGAANQEIVGGPFAIGVLSPGFAQPFAIGFEAAGGEHAGPGLDALGADPGGDEAAVAQFDAFDRRVVADPHPERLGAAVVGID